MPIHDWKRVRVGLFHHFHQTWATHLAEGLNAGVLPEGYFALVEQRTARREPDILALNICPADGRPVTPRSGVALADAPPKTRYVTHESDIDAYARKADRVGVRNEDGELVAVIEIVSPGNKHSKASMKDFLDKTSEYLQQGVHLLVIDLFPPTPRDPHGIHKAIWDEFQEEPFDLPTDKPLVLESYDAATPRTAYVETVAVGDALPAMPVILNTRTYILAPLEESYVRTWDKCPREMKNQVENPPA